MPWIQTEPELERRKIVQAALHCEVPMRELCALVPPPRKHLVTYHGTLAPASGLRPKVVPRQTAAGENEG
jgi:hypothetical protein